MRQGFEKRMSKLEARMLPPEIIVVERLIVGKGGIVEKILRHGPDGRIEIDRSSSGTVVGDCVRPKIARDRGPNW